MRVGIPHLLPETVVRTTEIDPRNITVEDPHPNPVPLRIRLPSTAETWVVGAGTEAAGFGGLINTTVRLSP